MHWMLVGLASFFVGLSKTGIPGVGIMAVGLFATVLPARESAGIVLPLLICADIVAVISYWREARWTHLLRLFPWAIFGNFAGYVAVDYINAQQTGQLIGLILISMVVLQLVRSRQIKTRTPGDAIIDAEHHGRIYTASMGTLAGFTTMVANAAGPIINLYLVAMRMPKIAFMGTAAWYFFLLNSFKIPFSMRLGLINRDTVLFDLKMAPLVLMGAVFGRMLLPHINQKIFETLALAFALAAGIRLLAW